jgi:hypothetical protein
VLPFRIAHGYPAEVFTTSAGQDAQLFGEASVTREKTSVSRILPAVTSPRECVSGSTTSQGSQKVVVLLIDDESVNSGSVASFQKVIDLAQKVVDSFFGFNDRFEADDRPPVGTRDLT